ncbi:hypothetical protein WDW89_02570 [Deltaproteobacteria bacterium TL4]
MKTANNTLYVFLTAILLSIILSGCGNALEGTTDKVPEQVVWHDTARDHYLVIKKDQTYVMKRCSVNNGYVDIEGFTGKISGDSLIYNGESYNIIETEDTLTIVIDDSSASSSINLEYVKETEVPKLCTGDAVDIGTVTPSEPIVNEKNELEFESIEVLYRLNGLEKGEISIGFNVDPGSPGIVKLFAEKIVEPGTASAVFYEKLLVELKTDVSNESTTDKLDVSNVNFKVFANLSQFNHPAAWTPLASVFKTIALKRAEVDASSDSSPKRSWE